MYIVHDICDTKTSALKVFVGIVEIGSWRCRSRNSWHKTLNPSGRHLFSVSNFVKWLSLGQDRSVFTYQRPSWIVAKCTKRTNSEGSEVQCIRQFALPSLNAPDKFIELYICIIHKDGWVSADHLPWQIDLPCRRCSQVKPFVMALQESEDLSVGI